MAQKSSQWNKKDKAANKGSNVTEFPTKQVEVEVEVAAEERKPPTAEDYMPLDKDGNPKEDGRKRIMLMIDADGSTLFPVAWFGPSVLEVSVALAEATKLMAVEVAQAVIRRDAEVQQQIDSQIAAALRKLGVFDVESNQAEVGEEPTEGEE